MTWALTGANFCIDMAILLRKSDVLDLFNGNHAAVGRDFNPALSRVAVLKWPEFVPELRARQLLDRHPRLKELQVDPETGLSLREMRERLSPPAQPTEGQA